MVPLLAILGSVPGPRTGNAQRHALPDMRVIALAASVRRAESCVDFAGFAEDREVLLREFLRLENGLPSHDTFSRLFRLLDPQAFGPVFAAPPGDPGADGAGVLATSGKTLRRSFGRAAGRPHLHVVTAFGTQARLVIGQSAVLPGGNGITAAQALLETLCLEGALVTADAIHAQAETAALILRRGGDYLLALKGNHPLPAAEVAGHFADRDVKLTEYQTVDADHGRIWTRIHRVDHDVDWLFPDRRHKGGPRFPGLACIACVQSTHQTGATTTTATRFHLSPVRLTPARFATAVRARWAIETTLHWAPDVTVDEDRARNRKDNGPENLTFLRKLTLNLLQKARSKLPVSRKRKRSGWSSDFARTIPGQMRVALAMPGRNLDPAMLMKYVLGR
jgi:predicted transposase YbfD/YdcC